jgi:hypothetical protein
MRGPNYYTPLGYMVKPGHGHDVVDMSGRLPLVGG